MDENRSRRLYGFIWILIIIAIVSIPAWSIYTLSREYFKESPGSRKSAGRLVKDLKDNDFLVRRAAIIELGELGEKAGFAVPDLITCLEDEDDTNRLFTVMTLGMIGPGAEAAVPALKGMVDSASDKWRMEILKTLASIGNETDFIFSSLEMDIAADDESRQLKALSVLERMEIEKQESIARLVDLMDSDSAEIRRKAAAIIMSIRSSSIPMIDEIIGKADIQSCLNLADSLGAMGQGIMPYLKESLESENKYKCWTAALGICKNGAEMELAIPVLAGTLDDEDDTIRSVSVSALSSIGAKVLPVIIEKLESCKGDRVIEQTVNMIRRMIPDGKTRAYHHNFPVGMMEPQSMGMAGLNPSMFDRPALGDPGAMREMRIRQAAMDRNPDEDTAPDDKKLKDIIGKLRGGNDKVIFESLSDLLLYDTGQEKAIPELVSLLKHDDVHIHDKASQVLMKIGEEALPALTAEFDGAGRGLRNLLLNTMAASGVKAVPYLLKNNEVIGDSAVIDYLFGASKMYSDNQEAMAVPLLLKALDNADYFRALRVINILSRISPASPETLEKLNDILGDDDVRIRLAALDALLKLYSDDIEEMRLLTWALDDPDYKVRANSAYYLGNMNFNSDEAAALLKKALRDDEYVVRWKAAVSLGVLALENKDVRSDFIKALKMIDNDIKNGNVNEPSGFNPAYYSSTFN